MEQNKFTPMEITHWLSLFTIPCVFVILGLYIHQCNYQVYKMINPWIILGMFMICMFCGCWFVYSHYQLTYDFK